MNTILQQPSPNYSDYKSELNKHSLYLNKYRDEQDEPAAQAPAVAQAVQIAQPVQLAQDTQASSQLDEDTAQTNFVDIVGRSGPREKRRMLSILDRLSSPESQLKWNSHFQIVDKGVPIQGSNLFDLLKVITGERKQLRPTPGLSRFAYHLNLLNTPQATAGSENARRLLQSGQVDHSLDPLLSHDGTYRPLKRKRVAATPGQSSTAGRQPQ